MTDLTVIPKITLDEVADSIRDGFNKIDRSFSLFAEGTLQIGRALLIGRELHGKDDRAFGRWIGRNNFNRLDKNARAALMNMARHEEISRQVLLETDRRSWRLLWEHEIQFKVPMERWPEPPLRKEPPPDQNETPTIYSNAAIHTDSEPEPPKQAEVEILVGPGHFVPVSQLKPIGSPEEQDLMEEVEMPREFPWGDSPSAVGGQIVMTAAKLKELNSMVAGGRLPILSRRDKRQIKEFLDEVEELIKEVEVLKSWFSKTGERA